jgi:phenolic acid decarboxylase
MAQLPNNTNAPAAKTVSFQNDIVPLFFQYRECYGVWT